MPGPRQLTLVEAWRGASMTHAAATRGKSDGIRDDRQKRPATRYKGTTPNEPLAV
jgi:hypothetical protein